MTLTKAIIKPLSLEELSELAANYPDLDPKALEVYNEFTRTSRLLVAVIDRAASHRPSGLSAGRNAVLWAVMRYTGEEGITPAEIADALDITRATVTGLLSALEQDNLVTRVNSVEDRRRVYVKPTDEAHKYITVEWPETSRDITDALSELTGREKDHLLRILQKVRRGTSKVRTTG